MSLKDFITNLNTDKSEVLETTPGENLARVPGPGLEIDGQIFKQDTVSELVTFANYVVSKIIEKVPAELSKDVDITDDKLKAMVCLLVEIKLRIAKLGGEYSVETGLSNAMAGQDPTNTILDRDGGRKISTHAGLLELGLKDPNLTKLLELVQESRKKLM